MPVINSASSEQAKAATGAEDQQQQDQSQQQASQSTHAGGSSAQEDSPGGDSKGEEDSSRQTQQQPAAAAQAVNDGGEALDFQETLDTITEMKLTGDMAGAKALEDRLGAQQTAAEAEAKKSEVRSQRTEAASADDANDDDDAGDEQQQQHADDGDGNADDAATGTADDEQPAGAQPPGDAATAKKAAERVRINHLSEDDKNAQIAITALTRTGKTLREATEIVLGKAAAPAETPDDADTQAQQQSNQQQQAATNPDIAEMESTVENLEAQLMEAGAGEGLFNAEIAKLQIDLNKATTKLEIAKMSAQQNAVQESRERASFEAQRTATSKAAMSRFPDLGNKDSELFALTKELALAAHYPGHPDHDKVMGTQAPLFFAERAAKLLKIAPKGAKPTSTATPAPKPVVKAPVQQPQTQQPPVRPASGGKGSATPKSGAQRVAESEDLTEAVLTGRAQQRPKGTVHNGVFIR